MKDTSTKHTKQQTKHETQEEQSKNKTRRNHFTMMPTLNDDSQHDVASSISREACLTECQRNQQQFPNVRYMTSQELQERLLSKNNENNNNNDNNDIILVDVRTVTERNVSMIIGSITLQELYQNYLPKLLNQQQQQEDDEKTIVVLYCTIGYRSGLEARRLMEYSNNSNLLDIYSLDGIVPFTYCSCSSSMIIQPATATTKHSLSCLSRNNNDTNTESNNNSDCVVHAFGSTWRDCTNPKFETRIFQRGPIQLMRLLQVGALVFVRSIQHEIYKLRNKTNNR